MPSTPGAAVQTLNDLYDVNITSPVGTPAVLRYDGASGKWIDHTPAAAITAPATQTAAYVQADVESIVTAVNSIRAALTAVGITL